MLKLSNAIFVLLTLASLVLLSSCTKEGPIGPQGPAGQNGTNGQNGTTYPSANASFYFNSGLASSSVSDTWVETTPSIAVTVPETGKYLVYASGRAVVVSSSACINMRVVDGVNTVIATATCVCGSAGVQGTGSVSRILNLTSGQVLKMQFLNGVTGSNWQYGGDDVGGASSLSIVKVSE